MAATRADSVQALDGMSGKTSLECLSLFRNLMVDVVVSTSYGYRLGAVHKWSMNTEDPLSTAINDFPKRGILVCVTSCSFFAPLILSDSEASFPLGPGILSARFPTLDGVNFVTLIRSWLRCQDPCFM